MVYVWKTSTFMIYISEPDNNCAFLFFVDLLQFNKPVSKAEKIPKLFYQLALECIKLLLRRTKRGKKDPEMTKETVVHPFLVVCNKLSCQYHWNFISRVSFKENWNNQLSGPWNQKLNIGMSFHKHNPLLRNQAYN